MSIFDDLQPLQSDLPLTEPESSPYIVCNEQSQQETLGSLASQVNTADNTHSLHVGFSVWFNLDVIATTRPAYAAIFDIDPAIHAYIYPVLKSTILEANSRQEFVDKFLERISMIECIAPYNAMLSSDFDRLTRAAYGFLASEGNFNYLKMMFSEGRVFCGKADLTKQEHLSILSKWISRNELKLNTLYLSNIPEWLFQMGKESWRETQKHITTLLQPCTQIIDAFYPTMKKDGSGPPQRMTLGAFPGYQLQPIRKRPRELFFHGQLADDPLSQKFDFSMENEGNSPKKPK